MNVLSPNLNLMIKAGEKASKKLIRDFGEVENLQVSIKGPTDFVSNADLNAEKIIINELSKSIASDDLDNIKKLLVQLGKTPFYKKEKPSPYEEAVSLIWFLENVFYHSASTIYNYIDEHIIQKTLIIQSLTLVSGQVEIETVTLLLRQK